MSISVIMWFNKLHHIYHVRGAWHYLDHKGLALSFGSVNWSQHSFNMVSSMVCSYIGHTLYTHSCRCDSNSWTWSLPGCRMLWSHDQKTGINLRKIPLSLSLSHKHIHRHKSSISVTLVNVCPSRQQSPLNEAFSSSSSSRCSPTLSLFF